MKGSKFNIVVVTSEFPPQPGGIGNHAYNLALHLAKNDHEVSVIADQRSMSGHEEAQFDASLPFKVARIKRSKLRFLMYFKRIIVTYKSMKSATHCIATGKFSLWNVAFLNLFVKRKTLAVIHGTEVNFKSVVLRKSIDASLNQFKTIVAVSNYTKDLVAHLKKDVQVIPNGITLTEWKNSESKISLKGHPVLCTVGRVSSRKGQLNVIKHLPELIKYYPDVHYHCIGIPSEAEAFMQVAKSLNVSDHITFHGSVDDKALKQVLGVTDVFVMLSSESKTGDVEGFGIAILEANAMGIPAIGSKGCGIEDAINTNKSGVLIDVNDTQGFAKGVSQILENSSKFKEESLTWAKAHDWSIIVKRYEDLL